MGNASDTYIHTQVQSALIEVADDTLFIPFAEMDDIATALIEALGDRGIRLEPT